MHLLTKRFVTLIEMMIVMFLIALITGVIAYNYRGSLDEGKVFKTKAGIDRLETILNLEAAKDPSFMRDVSGQWEQKVKNSALVKDADSLIYDGWGDKYDVSPDQEKGGIKVISKKYEDLKRDPNKSSMFK